MSIMFHVSSVRNRRSIRSDGLDVSRMGAAPGIAGSTKPEADGIFLSADVSEVDWFVGMNNTGGPVDVWQVEDVDVELLVSNGSGYFYLPGRVASDRLSLVRRDVPAADW